MASIFKKKKEEPEETTALPLKEEVVETQEIVQEQLLNMIQNEPQKVSEPSIQQVQEKPEENKKAARV